jgi:CubicO group peptidase (beta-lactamase class C family)
MSAVGHIHADLDDFFVGQMSANQLPGLAACIVRGSDIARIKGYGWANIASRQPMSPDTVMNIGSISKTVTATAVMQLVQQGCIDIYGDFSDETAMSDHDNLVFVA